MTCGVWTRRTVVGATAVRLRVRTRLGRAVAMRNLRLLEVALIRKGWRCLWFHTPQPRLWVYAGSGAREVGTLVTVRAVRGGWCYYRSSAGLRRPVASCGDVGVAAELLDAHLKARLFPGTFPG
ncbi:hypothetical protein [Actinomadura sp. WMMB 499]|uniref:hypothetical protein n=1 Tax=Actinomadura sp. WMMB 499 TaxID=1219491 RepID=UPI001246503E|nr:hypothetical protein [Actinomadura sp. WMMB 499]QFG21388.1 hypothetical protein F7P10_09815 [Actinomadura sp. WMMB 499]